jgi:hypothetical protein
MGTLESRAAVKGRPCTISAAARPVVASRPNLEHTPDRPLPGATRCTSMTNLELVPVMTNMIFVCSSFQS